MPMPMRQLAGGVTLPERAVLVPRGAPMALPAYTFGFTRSAEFLRHERMDGVGHFLFRDTMP